MFSSPSRIGPAELVIGGTALFTGLSFVLYYLIDLKNTWGSRDWLFGTEGVYFYFTYTPFFFQHYGRDGGFAEVVQWGLLAGAITLALYYAGRLAVSQHAVSRFWLILGVGMLLMLLEDAGEVRHLFMSYIQWAANEPDQGIVGTIFEAGMFVVLGGLPIYAVVRYYKVIMSHGRALWYTMLGISAHAVAASLSFVGTAFQMTLDTDVYSLMGDAFKRASLAIADPGLEMLWNQWDAENWLYQVDFFLMDSFVEENIELFGNAFFLAAALSVFTVYTHQTSRQEKVT